MPSQRLLEPVKLVDTVSEAKKPVDRIRVRSDKSHFTSLWNFPGWLWVPVLHSCVYLVPKYHSPSMDTVSGPIRNKDIFLVFFLCCDAFEVWCWRRLLRVPWTARRSNQSILKEINPGISLEGMMLKLKLQYFGHFMRRLTHWRRLWCWEGLGAGGEGDDRGWDGWMASQTQWM